MNESLMEGVIVEGVGTITHPDACVCAGDCCALEEEDE